MQRPLPVVLLLEEFELVGRALVGLVLQRHLLLLLLQSLLQLLQVRLTLQQLLVTEHMRAHTQGHTFP